MVPHFLVLLHHLFKFRLKIVRRRAGRLFRGRIKHHIGAAARPGRSDHWPGLPSSRFRSCCSISAGGHFLEAWGFAAPPAPPGPSIPASAPATAPATAAIAAPAPATTTCVAINVIPVTSLRSYRKMDPSSSAKSMAAPRFFRRAAALFAACTSGPRYHRPNRTEDKVQSQQRIPAPRPSHSNAGWPGSATNASRNPHSAIRNPHSSFCILHSAFPHFLLVASARRAHA